MAKKIIKYQADDGVLFDVEAEADHHNRKITVRKYFQEQFAPAALRADWDFSVAYVADDSNELVIAVSDLPDFLVENAARIQAGYALASHPAPNAWAALGAAPFPTTESQK